MCGQTGDGFFKYTFEEGYQACASGDIVGCAVELVQIVSGLFVCVDFVWVLAFFFLSCKVHPYFVYSLRDNACFLLCLQRGLCLFCQKPFGYTSSVYLFDNPMLVICFFILCMQNNKMADDMYCYVPCRKARKDQASIARSIPSHVNESNLSSGKTV